ncbi:hypothetical protein BH11PLA2_BH11PLA2_28440 [soil metagenome]
MFQILAKLCLLTGSLVILGCSGSKKVEPSEDESAKQKVEWMTKIADAVGQPNEEFMVKNALEKYRNIPFTVKSYPDAAQKILEIYNTRVKGKLKGEGATDVAGDMAILTNEMK